MSTIIKCFIIGVSLVLFGCISITESQKPPPSDNVTDNVTLEVKSSILEPWPEDRVGFHKAMYFATMAMRPDLRQKYQPINLYNICSCIVDILQATYTYEEFRNRYTGDSSMTPEAQQEVYAISYKCSQEEALFLQQQLVVPNVKDTI